MGDERVTLNFKWGLLDRQEERCTASWAQMALNEKAKSCTVVISRIRL